MGEQKALFEYVPGMRDAHPNLCWALLFDGKRCCIKERGHDGGEHEPESAPPSLDELSPAAMRCFRRIEAVLPPSDPTNSDDPSVALSTLAAILHAALTGGPRV